MRQQTWCGYLQSESNAGCTVRARSCFRRHLPKLLSLNIIKHPQLGSVLDLFYNGNGKLIHRGFTVSQCCLQLQDHYILHKAKPFDLVPVSSHAPRPNFSPWSKQPPLLSCSCTPLWDRKSWHLTTVPSNHVVQHCAYSSDYGLLSPVVNIVL